MSQPTLKLGSRGPAVTRAKERVNEWRGKSGNTSPWFGIFFRRLVKQYQTAHGIPATGVIGPRTWAALEPTQWLPPLVKPWQGFGSLTDDLWRAYTVGRLLGLTDLGTFNRKSVLPKSKRPSDHATSRLDGRIGEPACAFDLGFTPAVGYDHPAARKFFHLMVGRPEISYVICGDRIWSADRADEGVRHYAYGGHEGHVHTSGRRR